MAGYLLSGSAVKKTARVVKSQSTTPLRGGVQGSRRIGGQGGKVSDDTPTHPWKMSLFKKEDDDTQYCKIGSGTVATNITNVVPEGLVSLSTYGDGDTVYIYARIANNWQVGGSLNSYPTLTVLTEENETNFAGNNVRFPASDLGYYFLPIGTIDVEVIPDTDPVQLKYTINQIEKENTSIGSLDIKPLNGYSFLAEKGTDTATDTQSVNIVTEGYVKLPTGSSVLLSEMQETASLITRKYANIIINSTKNDMGFHESFTAEMEFSTSIGTDTATKVYFTAVSFQNNSPVNYDAYIISDGRVW